MAFKFIHTADWQLGAPFAGYASDLSGQLKAARRDVIVTIANIAREEGVAHVVVAGDVWDSETPSDATLAQPLELMAEAKHVTWWLMPGNHDVNGKARLWTRVAQKKSSNVRLLLTAEPVEAEPGVWFLPAPWDNKAPGRDLTAAMDSAQTPEGVIRIGIAHGSVEDFASETAAVTRIAKNRPDTANLDYLALGDWHGTRQMGPRLWYSGTPEPDRHVDNDRGAVLVVSIEAQGAVPIVKSVRSAKFAWPVIALELFGPEDIARIIPAVVGEGAARMTLARLSLSGRLAHADRQALSGVLADLEARLAYLDVRDQELEVIVEASDLDTLDATGSVRAAADELLMRKLNPALSAGERANAGRALDLLFTFASSKSED
ncbi:DNA repair exonuclease [Hyphomonas sp. WL0036]|uniref:metallophosphoesterase family protein n=1 Tax=Hyphomonas sediminis TaxID=2866160 RepID=UPI001C7E9862|nr:DNA repair exonuclease [Hyphomonas sediminis]MBY9068234.1 DNA repair exonuclease [Hyphomonas sediminis]